MTRQTSPETLRGICSNLIDIPLREKGTYDIKQAEKKYKCAITKKNCVGYQLDDSGEGPHPMYDTIYVPKIDTNAMFNCPVRNLSEKIQKILKEAQATESSERRISTLREGITKSREELTKLGDGTK
jgi:hypothetical protein